MSTFVLKVKEGTDDEKLYADILMTGLMCSAALTANAFEYVSSEAGFPLIFRIRTLC